MADYGQNPFMGALNPNMRQNGLWDLRMMSAANRMETPFEHVRTAGRAGLGPGAFGVQEAPDYSAFTFDPAMRAQAEAAGVNPLAPGQVKNNVVLPNTGFFGNHPGLSGALEGAMFGAASTRPSNTTGEGISNVFGGLIEGQQARQNLYKRQFEGPFQSASVLENLQDRQELAKERAETGQLRHTQMEFENERLRQLKEQGPYNKLEASRPIPFEGGYLEPNPDYHGPNWSPQGSSPNPWRVVTDPNVRKGSRTANVWAGVGTQTADVAREKGFTDPDSMTQADWADVNKTVQQRNIALAGGRAKAEATGRDEAPGHLTPAQSKQWSAINTQIGKLDSKESTDELYKQVLMDSNFKASKFDDVQKEVNRRREAKRTELKNQQNSIGNTGGGIPMYNVATGQFETPQPE